MSVAFRSRWLDWKPEAPAEFPDAPPTCPPAKPSKPGYEGFEGGHPAPVPKTRTSPEEAGAVVCYSCWGSDFWQGSGATVCRKCHPPAPGAEVRISPEPGSDARGPVEIEAGEGPDGTDARTNGVLPLGGAA